MRLAAAAVWTLLGWAGKEMQADRRSLRSHQE
jgi:hypothetical protein